MPLARRSIERLPARRPAELWRAGELTERLRGKSRERGLSLPKRRVRMNAQQPTSKGERSRWALILLGSGIAGEERCH